MKEIEETFFDFSKMEADAEPRSASQLPLFSVGLKKKASSSSLPQTRVS
jgi:hypothetical protein